MRCAATIVLMVAGLVALAAGSAGAGLIAGDVNGLPAWQGTVHFQATPSLFLDVDYCVYAPGDFGDSFGAAADPSGGTQYVYAYQILNDLPNHPAPDPTKDYVTSFSIGLTGLNELAANVGAVAVTDGKNPNHSAFAPTTGTPNTVKWTYTTSLKSGSFSNILIYTSPFAPEFDNSTILGYSADTHLLPSPTPEPATLTFLAIGLAAVIGKRGWRRTSGRRS
jgi:hypothetical protein